MFFDEICENIRFLLKSESGGENVVKIQKMVREKKTEINAKQLSLCALLQVQTVNGWNEREVVS